jgi:hypothetical protein
MTERRTAQTACPYGHPFPENLRRRGKDCHGKPRTYCRACRNPKRRTSPDPVAIERAVAGNPPAYLHHLELAAAIRQLDSRGRYTAQQIAERVGCARRTVFRIRARSRQAATDSRAAA